MSQRAFSEQPFFIRQMTKKGTDEEEAELMRKYGSVISGRKTKKTKAREAAAAAQADKERRKKRSGHFVSLLSDGQEGVGAVVTLPGSLRKWPFNSTSLLNSLS